jgi:tRNA U34 5-methylaminomethyl-2-thiouridine-forming methyltransferase MnmC
MYLAGIKRNISVLEVGFGTGLNALLTLVEAEKNDLQILYDVVELYPLDSAFIASLNYLSVLQAPHLLDKFSLMHECEWETTVKISGHFDLKKIYGDIRHVELAGNYDLIYFDVFDPASQPGLWTEEVFKKMYSIMNADGVLVTYSSKGIVRKRMEDAGFRVMKLEGPKGKREIVRACIKIT